MGWNTWAELILAAAVLRHGQQDWNVVALKLRTGTLFTPTPEVCKTKYEELQKRYSGSRVWFEELRKQCVAELKQELARPEASTGFLESKIKYLEAEKQNPNQADYAWSQTESPLATLNSDGTEHSFQNISKDERSAGSYTKDPRTRTSLPCKCHDLEMEIDTKLSLSVSSEHDKDLGIAKLANAGEEVIARKRRGQRKRKNCKQAITEGSVGESDKLGSSNAGSTSREEAMKDHNASSCTVKINNLMEIFHCIAQSEPALVFKHRMDSQKRERYRKIIRQHVDIGMIRARIIRQSIKSAKELFRDLLLLASNALVFYSRRTREYRSALSLRHLIMKEYKQHCRGSCHKATPAFLLFNPPVRPLSARHQPCKDKLPEKWLSVEYILPANDPNASENCVIPIMMFH